MADNVVTLRLLLNDGNFAGKIELDGAALKGLGTAGQQGGKRAAAGMDQAASGAKRLGNQLDRTASQATKGFGAARRGVQSISEQLNRLQKYANWGATLVAGAVGLTSLTRMADGYTNLSSKIRLVTESDREMIAVRQQVFQIAQETRSALASTGDLYTKLARSTGDMNLSQQKLLDITRTINQSFIVSGASAGAADAAIQQLGQGLAAGALRGDEFNSVAEQAPIIMDLLADKLNMTRGELREFAAEGKITAQIMVEALAGGAETVQKQFDGMQMTIGGAFQQLKNSLTQYVGEAGTASGASATLADGISLLATHLGTIVTVAGVAFLAWLAKVAIGLTAQAALWATNTAEAIAYQAALARMAALNGIAGSNMAAGLAARSKGMAAVGKALPKVVGGLFAVAAASIAAKAAVNAYFDALDEGSTRNLEVMKSTNELAQAVIAYRKQLVEAKTDLTSLPDISAMLGTRAELTQRLADVQERLDKTQQQINESGRESVENFKRTGSVMGLVTDIVENRFSPSQKAAKQQVDQMKESAALLQRALHSLDDTTISVSSSFSSGLPSALDAAMAKFRAASGAIATFKAVFGGVANVGGAVGGAAQGQSLLNTLRAETEANNKATAAIKESKLSHVERAQAIIKEAQAYAASDHATDAAVAKLAEWQTNLLISATAQDAAAKANEELAKSTQGAGGAFDKAANSVDAYIAKLEQANTKRLALGPTPTDADSARYDLTQMPGITPEQLARGNTAIDAGAELDAQAAATQRAAQAMQSLAAISAREADQTIDLKAALAGASNAQIAFNRTQRDAAKALAEAGGAMNPAAVLAYGAAVASARENMTLGKELDDQFNLEQLLQKYEQISPFEHLIDDAGTLRDAMQEALGEGRIEDAKRLKAALGEVHDIMAGQMLGAAESALRGIQSLAERGSDQFKDMEKAIAVINLAQQILATTKAVNAILTQGEGDPYSAPFRMAAMAAAVAPLLASIGATAAAFSGGGPTDPTEARQAAQGTGTVLGDAEAKSESIQNAIEITADATSQLPAINRGMLNALTGVSKGIDGVTASIAGMTFDFRHSIDTSIGWWEGLFGGSVVSDSGLQIAGGKITDLINNVFVRAFEEVTVDEGWFSSAETSNSLQSLGDAANDQFSLILQSIVTTVEEAAKALGLIPADIQSAVDQFRIESQKISLEGMTGEEKNAALKAVFSVIFDGLAAAVVPFIDQFQKVGEGLGETLVRVATDVQVMQEAVRQLGLTLDVTDPEKVAKISVDLIEMVGGVEKFISGMQSFVDKFATEGFKFQTLTDTMAMAFEQAGLTVPLTRDAMWALMQSLDASTVAGREQIATLLRLADVSDQYYGKLEDSAREATDAAREAAAAIAATAKAQLDYAMLSAGLHAEVGQNPLARSLLEIAKWSQDTTKRLRELAQAAGMAGASETDLALVHTIAAARASAAIASLYESSQALVDQLYGTSDVADTASSAVSGFGDAMQTASQQATDAINLLLGNLSPFSDRKKLKIALQGQLAGTVRPEQVLEIGRRLMASGSDYEQLFNRVMAVGDLTQAAQDSQNYARTALATSEIEVKTLSKAERYGIADTLANNIADIFTARNGKLSFEDIANKLGLDLADLGRDLGLDNTALTDYLHVLGSDNFGLTDLRGVLAHEVDRLIAAIGGVAIDWREMAGSGSAFHPRNMPGQPYTDSGPDNELHPWNSPGQPYTEEQPIYPFAPLGNPKHIPATDPVLITEVKSLGARVDELGKIMGRYLPMVAENTDRSADGVDAVARNTREMATQVPNRPRSTRRSLLPVAD